MSRAERRHRSWQYARRAQQIHLRQAHPEGAVDGVCERSVWFFDKRTISQHRHHCPYCSPKYRETGGRPRVKRYMQRWGLAPRPWMLTGMRERGPIMRYREMFWTNVLTTFPCVLGAVLGLLPALLLVGGTVGLALRVYHQRHMTRLESARAALGLNTDTYEANQERSRARYDLQTGH